MKIKTLSRIIAMLLALCFVLCSCGKADKKPSGEKDAPSGEPKETAAFSANHKFNTAEMAYLFYGTYGDFCTNYSSYMSYIGLDTSKSLKEQQCTISSSDTPQTWFEYFAEGTKLYAEQYLVLCEAADANGVTLTDEEKEDAKKNVSQLRSYAEQNEMTINELLSEKYKNDVTEADILSLMTTVALSLKYYDMLNASITYTEDDFQKYCEENFKDEKDYKFVNVRHILVDDEKLANELLKKALAADDVEAEFSKLADENTTDPGSKGKGGLYEDVKKGQMVAEFENWCFADGRKVGDTGVVKTEYGYHVMYLSSFGDSYFRTAADSGIKQQKYSEEYEKLKALYPVTFNDELINNIEA